MVIVICYFRFIRDRFLSFQLPIFIEQLVNGCKVPKNKISSKPADRMMDVDVRYLRKNFRYCNPGSPPGEFTKVSAESRQKLTVSYLWSLLISLSK